MRLQKQWDLMLKVVTELLSYIVIVQLFFFLDLDNLFWDYSRFIWITVTFYFNILHSICTFLASEMEPFMAVVNDVVW